VPTTILVTGGNGFVGSHLVPALIDAGHDVRALVCTDATGATVRRRLTTAQRSRLTTHLGDVTRPETLRAAINGADAVLHLVALPRDWDGGASLRLVNTEGTRFVLKVATDAGIRRFVHLGAMGVTRDPTLHYANTKAAAIDLVQASGLDWTVLSPSVMYGPRDGFFNILADLVRLSPGVTPITGSGNARFQPFAVADLARAAVQAFDDDSTIRRELLLGGPRYWTYREIMEEVLRGMGKRRALVPMPVPLIRLVAASAEAGRLKFFPVATDQLRQLKLDNIGPLHAVREQLGWDPQPMEGNLTHLRRPVREQEPDAA
jgi:uncharacterized protein YbjT (DUF2867 family)